MKIIMPCGLTIESRQDEWATLPYPTDICRQCENSECTKRLAPSRAEMFVKGAQKLKESK